MAAGWRAMWDVARQPGPAEFEQAAAAALTAWRAGMFELPDYYLALTAGRGAGPDDGADARPDFYLGSGQGESGVGGLDVPVEPAVHP
ncbi:MAG: hypothetical protein ACRDOL_40120 [Streptosporangiaceae bacterium]